MILDDGKNIIKEELIDKFEKWLCDNFTNIYDECLRIDGVSCRFDSFGEMMKDFDKTFKK